MRSLRLRSLAGGLGVLAAVSVQAETLLVEFDTRVSSAEIDIPAAFSDLNERFDADPANGEFSVRLILPDFEKYAEGTHKVSLNVGNGLNYGPDADAEPVITTEGLVFTLESRLFGALEGIWKRVQTRDADGKRVRSGVLMPDESQLADYGTLTIEDGVVTRFDYGWVEADNAGLISMRNYLVGRRGFPVEIAKLTIDVSAFSEPTRFGDIVLVEGLRPTVAVQMAAASQDD